ncbi:MAG: GMC family oxidoreductase [Actinomycetota bacterium]|nr:GMC family oxidoreductase [Actinomycetota bacterium]
MSESTSIFTSRQRRTIAHLSDILLPEGHGLPGGSATQVGNLLERQIARWDRVPRSVIVALVRLWDLSPLLAYRKRFSSLDADGRERWTRRAYRSRIGAWRQVIVALKQLLYLAWASAPEVEDALGFDYRCAKDDEPHGAGRAVIEPRSLWKPPQQPFDYSRRGPAIESGAIPRALTSRTTFVPAAEGATKLETMSWPDVGDGMRARAEVVVIGSGAGGAVVAATLAEAGVDVVVLEEGPEVDSQRDFSGPLFRRFEHMCRDRATTMVLGRPPIPLPLGRVVGGTTVVNSGTCFRAPDRVLDRWSNEYGVGNARPDELEPHYKEIEDFLNVRPVPWELLGANGMAAHKGAVALGYSGGPLLRNISDCHGCGQCAFGCPTDAKQAMHVSYLPRAARAGARIMSGCRVDRIVVDDGRATGVEATVLGPDDRTMGTLRIDAAHVVSSAGAIHTPALLQASGIVDAGRQTGRNLRIHPATGVAGSFDEGWVSWKGTLQSYYIDEFFDSHELMFEATTAVPGVAAPSVAGIGAEAMAELGGMSRMSTLGFYVSDTSAGRVRRLPSGRVITTYKLNALDTRRMGIGLAKASEVLLAAGAERVHVGLPGLKDVSSREDLAKLERGIKPEHLRLSAFHPMGTARMGADPARAVVDSYGAHHSLERLWVADASVFPSCVAVNPQMTIMAFAKRTAERIATGL